MPQQPGQPGQSNGGVLAAVLGGLAAVGSAAVVGVMASRAKPTRMNGAVRRPPLKKPCGCGR